MSQISRQEQADGKKRQWNNKSLWKIGLILFIVVACSILFYFAFFRDKTLFGFFKSIWSNITPFIVGGVLAYLLKPVCLLFERWTAKWFSKLKNRYHAQRLVTGFSVTLTMLVFLALIYVLFAAIIPQVTESAKMFTSKASEYITSGFDWLEQVFKNNEDVLEKIKSLRETAEDNFGSSSNIVTTVSGWLNNLIEENHKVFVSSVTVGVKGVLNFLKNLVIGLISCVYILGSHKKLGKQGKMIIYSVFPEKAANKIMEELRYVDKMFSGFINGKIIDSIIIGLLCFIVCTIFRIPYALLISVIVGVTNIIPFFGPFIGAIPSAFIVLMVSPIKCLTFIIIIIAIQQLDGNVIGPKILGNTTGLSSFWVLFSITLFGGLWGFAGMIVGVPLFAVLYDIVRQLVGYGLEKRKKNELYESYEAEQEQQEQAKLEIKAEKKAARAKRFKKFKIHNKDE